jgi:hypothetical protein
MDSTSIHTICFTEFNSIVERVIKTEENVVRVIFKDSSYCDIWYSLKLKGRYSIHYERRHIDDKIFRFDNIPHRKWKDVKTFPAHFHNGREDVVKESPFYELNENSLRYFLNLVIEKIRD